MSEKIDLDALEREIIAFGSVMDSEIDGDWLNVELEVTKFRVHRDGTICENDGTVMTGIVLALARHVAPAPAAPDAGLLREDAIVRFIGDSVDTDEYGRTFFTCTAEEFATEFERILALLPPRIDGVLVPRELAERAVDAFRDSTAWDRHVGFGDKRTRAALADADQLRALLGREGV